MGAKKDRDKEILKFRRDKNKELAKAYKKYNISQKKIDKIEEKEEKFKNWLTEVEAQPDY